MYQLILLALLASLPVGLFAETQNKSELSFFGAQLSGNAEGSIPPWQGALSRHRPTISPGTGTPIPLPAMRRY